MVRITTFFNLNRWANWIKWMRILWFLFLLLVSLQTFAVFFFSSPHIFSSSLCNLSSVIPHSPNIYPLILLLLIFHSPSPDDETCLSTSVLSSVHLHNSFSLTKSFTMTTTEWRSSSMKRWPYNSDDDRKTTEMKPTRSNSNGETNFPVAEGGPEGVLVWGRQMKLDGAEEAN